MKRGKEINSEESRGEECRGDVKILSERIE